jgi:hypothetical protein
METPARINRDISQGAVDHGEAAAPGLQRLCELIRP